MKRFMFPAPWKGSKGAFESWKLAILVENINHTGSAVGWGYSIWSPISPVIIIYALPLDMTHKSFLLYYILNIPEHTKISLLSSKV